MIRRTLGAAALALLAQAGPAMASAVTAPPQWTSDQVRLARPLSPEPALVFTLETSSDSPGVVARQTVTLARSFTLVESPGVRVLYDHALCRQFTLPATGKVFGSDSGYAVLAFRVAELGNRSVLGALLAHAKVESAGSPELRAYSAETELAVQARPVDPLTPRDVADGTDYLLEGHAVTQVRGAAAKLTADEAHALGRFLALNAHVHPQVRRGLVAHALLPARIEVEFSPLMKAAHVTYTLADVRRVAVGYPLPAGLTPSLAPRATGPETEAERRGIDETTAAIARPAAPTLAGLHSAAQGRRGLAVLLELDCIAQLYGRDLAAMPATAPERTRLAADLQVIKGDPDALKLNEAGRLAGDPKAAGDREAAARFVADLDTGSLPFGTFRYVTYANLAQSTPASGKWAADITRKMPARLTDDYWIHIAAFPWSSNVYKDLGDTYYRAYDTPDAWLAYDLGRAVDPNWAAGTISRVSQVEDRIRADQPDFF